VTRAGKEKASDLMASAIENEASPVGMHAFPGIGVLVEMGPVEKA